MEYKKYFFEILAIIGISACLGIGYNFYSAKPLSLLRTPEKLNFTSESSLFSDSSNEAAGNSAETAIDSSESEKKVNEDSLKKAEKFKIDSLAKLDSAKADINNHKSEYINISMLKKYLGDPRILLIDARPPDLFAAGHIHGAINIYPLQDDRDAYLRSIMDLNHSKTIIVYCDGGDCDLSHDVAKDLKNFAFNRVFIYHGGWNEWSKNAGKRQ